MTDGPAASSQACVTVAVEAVWEASDLAPPGRKRSALAECARINSLFKRIFNRRTTTLANCTACGADYVHPVEWRPHDGESWWMLLRCGACGVTREQTVSDSEAELYDRELDRAEHRMRRAAERLNRERLAEQAESFATALELDLIGAEDFARPPDGA